MYIKQELQDETVLHRSAMARAVLVQGASRSWENEGSGRGEELWRWAAMAASRGAALAASREGEESESKAHLSFSRVGMATNRGGGRDEGLGIG